MKISNINTTTTYNSIDTTLEYTLGTAEIDKYYFASEEVSSSTRMKTRAADIKEFDFKESDTPSYKFDNLKENTTYKIYSYGKDKNGFKSNVYETEVTTNEFVAPKITNVSHTKTLNSITVTVNAEKGSNEISKYYYSKDDGETYTEGLDSNTYTFDNLNDTTEYKIKIKVSDSEGRYSTEYSEAISTEVYIIPVVTSISSTTTYKSITITPVGTKGTNEISKYQYSINNGAWQDSNIFNNLNDNTSYNIRVKAIDTNNRESNIYETTIKTDEYKLPSVKNVTTSSDASTITVNVTGEAGDGTIKQYCYSRDNLDYVCNNSTSTTDSHTFSGLTSNTSHTLKVKIIDSNSRESVEYETSKSTIYVGPTANSISVTASSITTSGFTAVMNATAGQNPIGTYYFSVDGVNWKTSTTNSYTFSGLAANKTYTVRGYVEDSNRVKSATVTQNVTTGINLATYVKSLYTSQGSNGIYKHEASLANSAGDNSYRYTGANQNNYVCFGTEAATCDNDHLYRIIGVFGDQVKLIKNTSYGSYYWSGSNSNKVNSWASSTLNTNTLNGNFLGTFNATWQKKIATTSWKVGGNTYQSIQKSNANNVYTYEIVNPAEATTYDANIGLMYVSDYMYAASPTYWTYKANDTATTDYRAATGANWMYSGISEWTISRRSGVTNYAFDVIEDGVVTFSIVYASRSVRPCFYLNSNVAKIGGTGTKSNPYRIG